MKSDRNDAILPSEVIDFRDTLQSECLQWIQNRKKLFSQMKAAGIEFPLIMHWKVAVPVGHHSLYRQLRAAQDRETCKLQYRRQETAIERVRSAMVQHAKLSHQIPYYTKIRDSGGIAFLRQRDVR